MVANVQLTLLIILILLLGLLNAQDVMLFILIQLLIGMEIIVFVHMDILVLLPMVDVIYALKEISIHNLNLIKLDANAKMDIFFLNMHQETNYVN